MDKESRILIEEIAEVVAEIWLSGKNDSQVFDFHECSSRQRWVARLFAKTRAETLKEVGKWLESRKWYRHLTSYWLYRIKKTDIEALQRGQVPEDK